MSLKHGEETKHKTNESPAHSSQSLTLQVQAVWSSENRHGDRDASWRGRAVGRVHPTETKPIRGVLLDTEQPGQMADILLAKGWWGCTVELGPPYILPQASQTAATPRCCGYRQVGSGCGGSGEAGGQEPESVRCPQNRSIWERRPGEPGLLESPRSWRLELPGKSPKYKIRTTNSIF